MDITTIIVTIIVGVIAAAPGIYAVFGQRHKTKADTAEKWQEIAQRAAEQYDDLCRRVEKLERQVGRYKRVLDTWRAGIAKLIQQLVDHDLVPVWHPDDDDDLVEVEEK